MIKQHVVCWNETEFGTAAKSPLPEGELTQDRLEQAARLCCGRTETPVYFQYPLLGALVTGRCGLAVENGESYYFLHQLIADEAADIERLLRLRPLGCDSFLSSGVSLRQDSMPALEASSLADGDALSAAFHAIDWVFGLDAELLGALIAAVRLSVHGQCRQVCVLMEDEEAHVTRTAQQLMELLMRCLPFEEAALVRWSSLPLGDRLNAPENNVCFASLGTYRLSPMEKQVYVVIDLKKGQCLNLPREVEPVELEAARALLAHDLTWMERVFRGAARITLDASTQDLPIDLPDFESGMSVRQYFDDWTEALLARRSLLNNEAFAEFAHAEWDRLTDRLVTAAECTPSRQYLSEMQQIIQALRRREYAARLGMNAQSLVDMVALLLDALNWEELSLDDTRDVRLIQRLALYANSLDDDSCRQVHTGAALRMFHRLYQRDEQATLKALETMELLCREDPAQFDRLQALMRTYVLARCTKEADTGRDDLFVVFSMLAYVRFVDGVPDLRRLNALEQMIRQNCGERARRQYEIKLDDQRRRMSSHAIRHHRKRGWMIALYTALGLSAVGALLFFLAKYLGW